jgi:Amt family ammonium transporter
VTQIPVLPVLQGTPSAVVPADTAWMLVSTALVLLMTPALAFFYGGLVRSKNSLNTMMMSFVALGVIGVVWALLAYSLAFSEGNAVIGGTSNALLAGVGVEAKGTIPHLVFMAFQATFAIITGALISGAVVERMRFGPYIAFLVLWSLLVYAPIAHWVWGGGWLMSRGILDFAGGTVVHINAGISALVAALVLGARKDYSRQAILPHNVPFTLLGAGLLWFGWFGFNGGSALAANELAGLAFTNTFLAPAATFPSYFVIMLRSRTRLDDSLDVFAGHGVGGLTGALLTGVFALKAWNSAGADGLLAGNPAQLGIQALGSFSCMAYAGIMTFIILKVLGAVTALRAAPRIEGVGMDVSQHGEEAYASGEGSILVIPETAAASAPTAALTPQAVS